MSDASQTSFVAFYAENLVDIKVDDCKRLIENMAQLGYSLIDGYAFLFDQPDNILSDSTQIERKLLEMLSAESYGGTLDFWCYPFEVRFSLMFEPEAETQWMIDVENDVLMGVDNNLGAEHSLKLLEVLKLVLSIFPPFYGCLMDFEDFPATNDVFDRQINQLFGINYFRTDLAEHLQINQIPSESTFCLEEVAGGTLLIPTLESIYELEKNTIDDLEELLGWSPGRDW